MPLSSQLGHCESPVLAICFYPSMTDYSVSSAMVIISCAQATLVK